MKNNAAQTSQRCAEPTCALRPSQQRFKRTAIPFNATLTPTFYAGCRSLWTLTIFQRELFYQKIWHLKYCPPHFQIDNLTTHAIRHHDAFVLQFVPTAGGPLNTFGTQLFLDQKPTLFLLQCYWLRDQVQGREPEMLSPFPGNKIQRREDQSFP